MAEDFIISFGLGKSDPVPYNAPAEQGHAAYVQAVERDKAIRQARAHYQPAVIRARRELRRHARARVVEWDEYCQGYGPGGELLLCICGAPYPLVGNHYCPYDEPDPREGEST